MKNHIQASLLWIFSLILMAGILRYLPGEVSVSTNVTGLELPITSVKRTDHKIAFTFNAAGDNSQLSTLMRTLESHQVKATFFLTGEWTDRYPTETVNLVQAGHELGILGDQYQDFTAMSPEEISLELASADQKIYTLTGTHPKLFRPPYGAYNNEVIRTASENGYTTVTWNVDSLDWKDYGESAIANTVLHHSQLTAGSILYFHVGSKYTPRALKSLLPLLEQENYSSIPLSELIYSDDFTLDAQGTQLPDRSPSGDLNRGFYLRPS